MGANRHLRISGISGSPFPEGSLREAGTDESVLHPSDAGVLMSLPSAAEMGYRLSSMQPTKDKTPDTAVVLIPPEELWEPIQAIRRIHDRHLKEWMPHVTLLYPFRPRERFDEAMPLLLRTCGAAAPFEVKLETFRSFTHAPVSHTMWIAPEPPEPLVDLQDALVEPFPDCDDTSNYPGGFRPHLSVGQTRDPLRVLPSLQSNWSPIRFRATEVTLIVRDPTGVFHVDRTVPLRSPGVPS